MDRRTFIAGAAAIPLFRPAIVTAAAPVKWNMATAFTRADPMYKAAAGFSRSVSGRTRGTLQIAVFGSGELLPNHQILEAVKAGTIACAQVFLDSYASIDPVFGLASGMPFGPAAAKHRRWLNTTGRRHVDRALAPFDAKGFVCGNAGVQVGGWYARPLKGRHPLRGLKFVVRGFGADIALRLGANVVALPDGEIYAAMERGIIDAAEFGGFSNGRRLGLDGVTACCYTPSWWRPARIAHFVVNVERWNELPRSARTAVLRACEAEWSDVTVQYKLDNMAAKLALRTKPKYVRRYPKALTATARKAARDVLDQTARTDRDFRLALRSLRRF